MLLICQTPCQLAERAHFSSLLQVPFLRWTRTCSKIHIRHPNFKSHQYRPREGLAVRGYWNSDSVARVKVLVHIGVLLNNKITTFVKIQILVDACSYDYRLTPSNGITQMESSPDLSNFGKYSRMGDAHLG